MADVDLTNPTTIDPNETLTQAGYLEEAPPGYSMLQKGLAEFVGTFTLIFIGAGSIVAAVAARGGEGGSGLVTIAIAHGLAIAVMVSAVGHISGGHLNPAVTVAAAAARKIVPREALLYIGAQLAGAVAGAAVLRGAVPESLWRQVNLGTPGLGGGVNAAQAVVIEAVLTFLLVWVIFATAVDPRGAFGKVAGLTIGFVVMMDIMAGGPFTGGAMNPARFLGPALVAGHWTDTWVYIVGPLVGGTLAGVMYQTLLLPRHQAAR
jgi:MIP family channel proteins